MSGVHKATFEWSDDVTKGIKAPAQRAEHQFVSIPMMEASPKTATALQAFAITAKGHNIYEEMNRSEEEALEVKRVTGKLASHLRGAVRWSNSYRLKANSPLLLALKC